MYGDKLIKDLLTNKIFSKQILSGNFKMGVLFEQETNMGIPWLKINALIVVKLPSVEQCYNSEP